MRLHTTTLRSSRFEIGIDLFWIILLTAGIAHSHNHLMEFMLAGWLLILAIQIFSCFKLQA